MADAKFFSIGDLGEMPPPRWLIDEMFEANSLVMVAGPPGSFKSFLVLDWLLCMASGRNWNGKATEPSRVLYVLGEGRSSLLKRIQAWTHYNRVEGAELRRLQENFKVTFEVPQMAQKASVDNLLASLQEDGYAPTVIAIDTFARSYVGMDENSPKDVGMWVENADRLRAAGFTVIFLHHTAKNTEFGVRYRGSTAILGAMDTAMTLMRDPDISHGVKLMVTKQKDHDEGEPLYFVRHIVTPPGSLEGSVVLVPLGQVSQQTDSLMQRMEKAMDILIEDASFESDRARARELGRLFGLSEATAQTKLRRRKQETGEARLGES